MGGLAIPQSVFPSMRMDFEHVGLPVELSSDMASSMQGVGMRLVPIGLLMHVRLHHSRLLTPMCLASPPYAVAARPAGAVGTRGFPWGCRQERVRTDHSDHPPPHRA